MDWSKLGAGLGGILGTLVAPGIGTAVGGGLGGALGALGDSNGLSAAELEKRRKEQALHELASKRLELATQPVQAQPAASVSGQLAPSNASGEDYDYAAIARKKFMQSMGYE